MPVGDHARKVKTRVLLVDDQPANILALRAILEPLDVELIEARSGEEALKLLQTIDVAVVLLDVQMPGLDGFETARLIRSRQKEPSTPIIFLTAFEDPKFSVEAAYRLGAVDYLVKPIVPTILQAKVAFFAEFFQKTELLRKLRYQEREKGEESEARKDAILETALDCVISIDHESHILEFNPAAERTFGYRKQEVLGRPMPEIIIPPRLREPHYRGLARYLKTGEGPVLGKRIEITGMRADGSEFPVELAIVAHGSRDAPIFTAYLRDITDLKRAAQERETLLASERASRDEAERAGRMKDEFLATLSHELRTPLNAILGYAQLVRLSNMGKADLDEAVAIIERNANLQAQLIDDLLDMNRIVSGKLRLHLQPVDVAEVIDAAASTVQPSLDAKGIRLEKFIDASAGKVQGDPVRLQQVVWNLLSNAIKFTPKGGCVQVTLQRVDSQIDIVVTDNGEGIAAEFLPHIFDRFRQADASTTRAHSGLGLGLSIVRHLVKLHNGQVRAESAGLGQGSKFTVTLPLYEEESAADQGCPEASPTARTERKPDLAGIQALIVDDEQDGRALVKRLLEDRHAVVETACSAEEAMRLIQTRKFDVLISDIAMPVEDGFQLLRRVRQRPGDNQQIPAVALSAFARSEDRRRAVREGFQRYLSKPVHADELIAVIAALVRG